MINIWPGFIISVSYGSSFMKTVEIWCSYVKPKKFLTTKPTGEHISVDLKLEDEFFGFTSNLNSIYMSKFNTLSYFKTKSALFLW